VEREHRSHGHATEPVEGVDVAQRARSAGGRGACLHLDLHGARPYRHTPIRPP